MVPSHVENIDLYCVNTVMKRLRNAGFLTNRYFKEPDEAIQVVEMAEGTPHSGNTDTEVYHRWRLGFDPTVKLMEEEFLPGMWHNRLTWINFELNTPAFTSSDASYTETESVINLIRDS